MASPIIQHMEIVRGTDYKALDGQNLVWYSPKWPNLASSTLSMVVGIDELPGSIAVTWKGTVPSSPATKVANLDVTATQTKEVQEGVYTYVLTAELADKDHIALATGQLTVQAAPGEPSTN